MRKKSHISLSGYLVRELNLEELAAHKKAFYLGSVLPDLNPNMIRSPHEYAVAGDKIRYDICRTVEEGRRGSCSGRVLWRRTGMIIHYLADFFTFPHNASYEGTLKDHCMYERDLKHRIRAYVRTTEAREIFLSQAREAGQIDSPEALMNYIEASHREYMSAPHSLSEDCRWIVTICSSVMIAMAGMICRESAAAAQPRYRCA